MPILIPFTVIHKLIGFPHILVATIDIILVLVMVILQTLISFPNYNTGYWVSILMIPAITAKLAIGITRSTRFIWINILFDCISLIITFAGIGTSFNDSRNLLAIARYNYESVFIGTGIICTLLSGNLIGHLVLLCIIILLPCHPTWFAPSSVGEEESSINAFPFVITEPVIIDTRKKNLNAYEKDQEFTYSQLY